MERCPRGRRERFAKSSSGFPDRGFESLLLRIRFMEKVSFISKIRVKFDVLKERTIVLYNRADRNVRIFIDYMKRPDSDPVYAAAGYIPFVGWLIPMFLRENSDLCQKNARQGLILSIIAAGFLLSLFFIELIVPGNLKVISFILIVLTYIFNIGYLTLSLYAMYTAAYKRIVRIPWVSDRSATLQL